MSLRASEESVAIYCKCSNPKIPTVRCTSDLGMTVHHMTLPHPAKIKLFLSDPENRKKLITSFIVGLVIIIGGVLLVKQISKIRPTENGAISTGNGENGTPVTPPPPPPTPLETLEESIKEYEVDLDEVGKFDFELYSPDLRIRVSF